MEAAEDTPLLSSRGDDSIEKSRAEGISDKEISNVANDEMYGNHVVINSSFGTSAILLNCMLGIGYLIQPDVFKEAGIFAALQAYLIFGYCSYTSSTLLVYLVDKTGCQSYVELMKLTMGHVGVIFTDFGNILYWAGGNTSYIVFMGTLSHEIFADSENADKWYTSSIFFILLWIITIGLPLCLVRRLGNLALVNYYFFVVTIFVIITICFDAPIRYYTSSYSREPIKYFNMRGLLFSIGSVIYCIVMPSADISLYATAQPSVRRNFTNYLQNNLALTSFGLISVGLICYLTFRESTKRNVLTNFSGDLAILLKFLIVTLIILGVPISFVIIRNSAYSLYDSLMSMYGQRIDMQGNGDESTETDVEGLLRRPSHQQQEDQSPKPNQDSQQQQQQNSSKQQQQQHHHLKEIGDEETFEFFLFSIIIFSLLIVTAVLLAYHSDDTTMTLVFNLTSGIGGSIVTFILPGIAGLHVLSKHGQMMVITDDVGGQSNANNHFHQAGKEVEEQLLVNFYYCRSWLLLMVGVVTIVLIIVACML